MALSTDLNVVDSLHDFQEYLIWACPGIFYSDSISLRTQRNLPESSNEQVLSHRMERRSHELGGNQ
jgi:hypothetical protein